MIARRIPSIPLIRLVFICSRIFWSFLKDGSPASTTNPFTLFAVFPTARFSSFGTANLRSRSSRSEYVIPRAFIRWSSGKIRTCMFTRSVSMSVTSSRFVISISWAILRIFSRSLAPSLMWISMIGVEGTRRASTISISRGRPRVTFISATPA